ncbi:hypothetical protein [Candidatus Burkholderia verschuerenii]|uniref:hypothetical protein n=1 Tax=Candidatus Burkholderia verschuerenii TaxID=242163 RepID=UPI00067BAC46|nr:hypothetical protein [Candidatus Burkholderia verschuerenii]
MARINQFDKNRYESGRADKLLNDRPFVRKEARDLHDGITKKTPAVVPGTRRANDEKRWVSIDRGFVLVYRATKRRVEILNVYHERELHPASTI